MKDKILVLTDFSNNAYDAAFFACQLARQKSYKVHLLHYYTVKSSRFDEEEDAPEHKHPMLLKADLLIIEMYGKLEAAFPDVKISISCKRGLLEEKLSNELKNGEYKFIVMGLKGESQHQSLLWGSTTAMITEKSDVPVWVIPSGRDTYKQGKIGLLTNFKAEELTTLRKFTQLNGKIDNLELIHVIQSPEEEKDILNRLETWMVNFKDWEDIKGVNPIIGCTEGDIESTIPGVINTLILQQGIEGLIITKTRRSFFRRLFEKSISKTLSSQLIVPTFFDK